jgi:hypothetical protein
VREKIQDRVFEQRGTVLSGNGLDALKSEHERYSRVEQRFRTNKWLRVESRIGLKTDSSPASLLGLSLNYVPGLKLWRYFCLASGVLVEGDD